VAQCKSKIEKRCAAADGERSVLGIGDGEPPSSIGIQFDRLAFDSKEPGLSVVG